MANYRNAKGERVKRSTKTADKSLAWKIAFAWEEAEAAAKAGRLVESQCRKVISDIHEKATGVTTNKALKAIWSGLRKKLPKLGFASKMPFELLPIYTDAHTAGCYMAQNFRESSENKNRHDGRIHLWGTTQNVPRVVPRLDSISLLTAGAAGWRKMVCLAAGSVGITSIEQLTEEYGHRWAHWGRKVVKWLFEETRANGVTPGIDAIREKMIEMCGRPLSWISPVDAGPSLAEQTWADIQAELIRMAPMRAAVLASQEYLAMAS